MLMKPCSNKYAIIASLITLSINCTLYMSTTLMIDRQLTASGEEPFSMIGLMIAVLQISGSADKTNNLENNNDKGNDNERKSFLKWRAGSYINNIINVSFFFDE